MEPGIVRLSTPGAETMSHSVMIVHTMGLAAATNACRRQLYPVSISLVGQNHGAVRFPLSADLSIAVMTRCTATAASKLGAVRVPSRRSRAIAA